MCSFLDINLVLFRVGCSFPNKEQFYVIDTIGVREGILKKCALKITIFP